MPLKDGLLLKILRYKTGNRCGLKNNSKVRRVTPKRTVGEL